MSKKKLSAMELMLKKIATLVAATFATKEDTYTKQEVNAAMEAVTDGAQAAELYQFRVDRDTMELKAISTMANLSCFRVEDGQLKISLSTTQEQ